MLDSQDHTCSQEGSNGENQRNAAIVANDNVPNYPAEECTKENDFERCIT